MSRWLQRLSAGIGAAALFLVMAIVFVSVGMRYLFGIVIPDSYDLPRMFLGILIFWGIALAVAEGGMIRIDFLHEALGPRGRRALDVFGTTVSLAVLALVAWRVGVAVADAFHNGVATQDLRIKLWPFYAVACAATLVCVYVAIHRLAALLVRHDAGPPPATGTTR